MGSSQSRLTNWTKEDLAGFLLDLGTECACVSENFCANGVDGEVLAKMSKDELTICFDQFGIKNKVHRMVLETKLESVQRNGGFKNPYKPKANSHNPNSGECTA